MVECKSPRVSTDKKLSTCVLPENSDMN
jgi:hypothetical protein